LYSTSLVVLWLFSPMTVNRLAFLIGVTIYFYVGSIFEERKLVAEFGEAYREYQRRAPRLIPSLRLK
jgi:protein-S-isoprenylcysteine O-methyltransferase Ste14